MTTVVSARLSRRSLPRLSLAAAHFPMKLVPNRFLLVRGTPLRTHPTGVRPRRHDARNDHRTDTGQLAHFRRDVFDRGIERLAVIDQLAIEGDDALGQPDLLLPACADNGVLAAVTSSRDHLELTAGWGLTRIDAQVDRAQQYRQGINGPGALSDHLLASHDQDPQHHTLARRLGATAAARCRPPNPNAQHAPSPTSPSCRHRDVAWLASPTARRENAGIGDVLGKPGAVGADTFDDDQRRLLCDSAGDPAQCAA